MMEKKDVVLKKMTIAGMTVVSFLFSIYYL